MRADLVALTPEALAALANLGLVKRAQKEIAAGKGPKIAEEPDGTVVGAFDDGVVAKLLPGRFLRDCPCSCPAPGVCRHRVAVALAYKDFASTAASVPASSPGAIEDSAIELAMGKRAIEEARALTRRGVVVEILRSSGPSDVPTARLPSCTVRFLVPSDLAYARCDCAIGQGCAHIAVAVWAFREADARDPARSPFTIELSSGQRAVSDSDAAAIALTEELVTGGVANAREALAQRFALARDALVNDGHVWTATALEDLEIALERYRARSARYRAGDVLALAAEIVARGRAARSAHCELPASSILGRGEAMEVKLDHLRLIGLGCRFDADDRERSVEILMADPDTGTVLVMERSFRFAAGEAIPDAPELARRRAGAGAIALLAKGQLVTRAARRRANRVLFLGTAQGQSSLTPQTGDLSLLPPPLRVDRIADLDGFISARPPRMLRPRVRAEDVHAIRVGEIESVGFDPGEQMLVASVLDPDGAQFFVRRGHRRAAAHALDELGRALLGSAGTVQWIVGETRREAGGWIVEPTMLVADRVIVPDVEEGGPCELPRGRAQMGASPLSECIQGAARALEEIVQLGFSGLSTAHEERLQRATEALEERGMTALATRTRHVAEATRAAKRDPTVEREAARAVIDAAIRLELAREIRSSR